MAQAIEVDSKPLKSILPFEVSVTCACMNKLHYIPCLLFMLKIVHVINFCGFHYPQIFFNNEIFPDYGIYYVQTNLNRYLYGIMVEQRRNQI